MKVEREAKKAHVKRIDTLFCKQLPIYLFPFLIETMK